MDRQPKFVEALESRRLLSAGPWGPEEGTVLEVEGTDEADVIEVKLSDDGTKVQALVNGAVADEGAVVGPDTDPGRTGVGVVGVVVRVGATADGQYGAVVPAAAAGGDEGEADAVCPDGSPIDGAVEARDVDAQAPWAGRRRGRGQRERARAEDDERRQPICLPVSPTHDG